MSLDEDKAMSGLAPCLTPCIHMCVPKCRRSHLSPHSVKKLPNYLINRIFTNLLNM
jgi:hypothetical protein